MFEDEECDNEHVLIFYEGTSGFSFNLKKNFSIFITGKFN